MRRKASAGVSLGACALAVSLTAGAAQAAVSYTGGTYSQNFDSLPNAPTNTSLQGTAQWTDDNAAPPAGSVSIVGWYLWHDLDPGAEHGTNGHQRLRASSGNSTTGSFYSFGTNSTTDRALGATSSNTLADPSPGPANQHIYSGLRLMNNSANKYNSFTLTYTGEQWRDGGNVSGPGGTPLTDTMFFSASLDPAATINSGAYTSFASLNFTGPKATTTAAALDGNAAANRLLITATINDVIWLPGTELWLRWDDPNIAGNDDGLGIDDLSFSATVPEPASIGLVVLGTVLLRRHRRA